MNNIQKRMCVIESESESESEYLFNIIYAILIHNLNNMVFNKCTYIMSRRLS